MLRRRVVGVLLIGVSLLSFTGALLDLPVRLAGTAGPDSFLTRVVPVFWLAAWVALFVSWIMSKRASDNVGSVLGCAGVCLSSVYLAIRYFSGRIGPLLGGGPPLLHEQPYFVLAPTISLALSVVTTILGWHLVMPPRVARSRSGVA